MREKQTDGPSVVLLKPTNLTENVWGGRWIPRLKGLKRRPGLRVGESWEFSAHPVRPSQALMSSRASISLPSFLKRFPAVAGNRAPLFLVKLIDASHALSVQVHPDNTYAGRHEADSGKDEAWLILETKQGRDAGHIYLGFNPKKAASYSTRTAFKRAFLEAITRANALGPQRDPRIKKKAENRVLPFLNKTRVRAGEVYDVRAGTVHAIGAGVRLCEIQQTSNLTYRIWDWNRPDPDQERKGLLAFRPLHLSKAAAVLDFKARPVSAFRSRPQPLLNSRTAREEIVMLNRRAGFAANRIRLRGHRAALQIDTKARLHVLTVLKGKVVVGTRERSITLPAGRTAFVSAHTASYTLTCLTRSCELIKSYAP